MKRIIALCLMLVLLLSACAPAAEEDIAPNTNLPVIENIDNNIITNIERTFANGYFSKTINTAVSGFATMLTNSVRLHEPVTLSAMVPNTDNHNIVNKVGAITAPMINSLIVLPLEICAINIPTNGHHAINHA